MTSKELIRQLEAAGWYWHSTVGSHRHFKHPDKPGKVTVPHPKKDLPIGTVQQIKKGAGL